MKMQQVIGLTFTVLVALLVSGPSSAGEKDSKEKDDKVAEQLRLLKEEVATLRKLHSLSASVTSQDLQLLGERLDRIERTLKRLADESTRGAMSINPAPVAVGTIRLDNRLGVRALVTIDGVTYTIDPLSTRELPNQPARAFIYEVTADGYGMGPPRRTTLAGREKLTLTIY